MGIRIYHNMAAVTADRYLELNRAAVEKSIESLSSGLRINRASDDAAGLTISEKLRGQVRGLNRASMNAQDGISMLQIAEGALSEVHSILQRMRELAVQAANDTLTQSDRGEIQKEIDQLKSEINRIAEATEFNTKKLLNGSATALVSTDSPGSLDVIVRDVVREGNYRIEKQHIPSTAHVLKSDIFNLVANDKNAEGTRGLANDFQSFDPIFGGIGEDFRSEDFTDFQNMDWSKDAGGASNQRQDFRVVLSRVGNDVEDQFYVVDHEFDSAGGKAGFTIGITGAGANQHPIAGDSGYYEIEVTALLDNDGTLLAGGGATGVLELTVRQMDASGKIVNSMAFNITHDQATNGADVLGADGAGYVTTGATSIKLGDAGADYDIGDKLMLVINAAEDLPDVSSGIYVHQVVQDRADNGFQLDSTGASVSNDTLSDRVGLWGLVGTSLDAIDGKSAGINMMYYDGEGNRQLGSGTIRYGDPGWTIEGEGYVELNLTASTLAERTTELRNIDKFQGTFELGAQTVFVYTADGDTTNVVLNGTDSLEDVAKKFRTAMLKSVAEGGLGLSVDGNLDRDTGVDGNIAVFVSEGVDNSDEAVAGTLIFRSTIPGMGGRLAFSAKQGLLDALSLATIREPDDPMTVRITDAHTGELIGSAVSDDGVIRNVIKGVDLVQDARSDLSVRFASGAAVMEVQQIIEGGVAGASSSQTTDIIVGADGFSKAAFINFQGLEPDVAAAGSGDNQIQDYEISLQASQDQFSVADFGFFNAGPKTGFSLANTLGVGDVEDGGANTSVAGTIFGGSIDRGLFGTPTNLANAGAASYQIVTVDNVNGNASGDQFAVADFSINAVNSDYSNTSWNNDISSTGLLTRGGYYEVEWSTGGVTLNMANMVDAMGAVATATIRAYDRNGDIVSTGSVSIGDTTAGAQYESTDAVGFFSNTVSGLDADYDVEGTYSITFNGGGGGNVSDGDRILFAVRDVSSAEGLVQLQFDQAGGGLGNAPAVAINDTTDYLTWDAGLLAPANNTADVQYGLMDVAGSFGSGGSASGEIVNLHNVTLGMSGGSLAVGSMTMQLGDHGQTINANGAMIFDVGVEDTAANEALGIGSSTRAGYFVVEVTGITNNAGTLLRTAGAAATLAQVDADVAGMELTIIRYSGTGEALETRTSIVGAASSSLIAADNTTLNLFGTQITDGANSILGFAENNAIRGNAGVILGNAAAYAVGDKIAFAVADGGSAGTFVTNLNNDATQDDGFADITADGGTFLHDAGVAAVGAGNQAVTRVGLMDNVGTLADAAGSTTAVSLGYFDANGSFRVGGGQVVLAQSGATLQSGSVLFSLAETTPEGPGFLFESAPGTAVEYVHIVDNRTVLHIGANRGQTLATGIGAMDAQALAIDDILVVSQQLAEEAIEKADDAIGIVSSERAKLGAYVNRLEHTMNVLEIQSENLLAAESRIRDLDMAKATIDFTRNQILMNAGMALLAQANTIPQSVLQLLRG